MEALPFHDNSDNDEEENGDNQDRKNEDKLRKEISDYEPVEIVGLVSEVSSPLHFLNRPNFLAYAKNNLLIPLVSYSFLITFNIMIIVVSR